jgi:hypothetical protein
MSELGSRARKLFMIAGAGLLALVAVLNVSASATQTCSIDAVASAYGINLQAAAAPVAANVDALISDDIALRNPGATVAADRVAVLASGTVPIVDGHRAVLRQLVNVPDGVIFGPAGVDRIPAAVVCKVAIYDADTGDFLASFQQLEPRR